MADYRKAKALLADQGAPANSPGAAAGAGQQQGLQQPDGGMWAKLMDEIDKVGMHRPPPSGTQLVRNCLCLFVPSYLHHAAHFMVMELLLYCLAARLVCRWSARWHTAWTPRCAACKAARQKRMMLSSRHAVKAIVRADAAERGRGGLAGFESACTHLLPRNGQPFRLHSRCRHILELRAVGVPAAAQMDPIRWVERVKPAAGAVASLAGCARAIGQSTCGLL